jgi:hypothetical protein
MFYKCVSQEKTVRLVSSVFYLLIDKNQHLHYYIVMFFFVVFHISSLQVQDHEKKVRTKRKEKKEKKYAKKKCRRESLF